MYKDCEQCGVSYDVGKYYCNEPDCKLYKAEGPKKKKYKAKARVLDPITSRHRSIVTRSRKKGITCTVLREHIEVLVSQDCVYCGSNEKIEVDRKDPKQGYTPENIAPACRRCNTIKNNVVTYEEMQFIAKYLGWRK